jgi:hypothetical protein
MGPKIKSTALVLTTNFDDKKGRETPNQVPPYVRAIDRAITLVTHGGEQQHGEQQQQQHL